MPSIISSGIGSGLDIAGIVQQLVAAEQQSVETRISKQEARAQVRLSAYGSLKSALSEFRDKLDVMRDSSQFLTRQAVSGDETLFTVSAGTTALPASYSIEVLQFAQAQKLTSGSFADADAVVGTGTLQIAVGAASFEVEITEENNTLSGIRDAINAAIDNQGVAATIVNADAGSYLILTGEQTGVSNVMTITQSGGDGGLAALEYDPGSGPGQNALTESLAAQDARVLVDGFEVGSSTNTIAGAVQGVTLTILAAAPGEVFPLDVVNDQQAVRTTVDDFVESYNQLVRLFDQLTSYDADSQLAGPLLGDATARTIRDQIRRELSTAVSDIEANFSSLSDVGIEIQLDGKLEIDDAALTAVLDQDFSKFGQLFAASDGYAVRLADMMEQYLGSDGTLESRTGGLDSQIKDIGEQREDLNERLARLEERLYRQFNSLDSLLAQLSQTSTFLTQQLNNLPGYTRPSNNR